MKKSLFVLPFIAVLTLSGCNSDKATPPPVTGDNEASLQSNYAGSYYKGNYIWGGAMNLAWTELNENIIGENLILNTNIQSALDIVEALNDPVFFKDDLDTESYYVKSGYGQKTVDSINSEFKAKFPEKSFDDLDLSLAPEDIISYAYFVKEVEYEAELTSNDVEFNGESVKGFSTGNDEQRGVIEILSYESDDKFIVSLDLKDESDELILAKGFDMTDPAIVVSEINSDDDRISQRMSDEDKFEAPIIRLDYHREYKEMIEKLLGNTGFENYIIRHMFENIKFDMDEVGAKVENEAVVGIKLISISPEELLRKNLILDKPYWIVMKQKDSENPYFILGVNNIELMEGV